MVVALALVGCSGDAGGSGRPSDERATVTETATQEPTSPSSSADPSPSDDSTGADRDRVPLCGTPDLAIDVMPVVGGGSAGLTRESILFTNSTQHACSLDGYAGVSYVGQGEQVGAAAERVSAERRSVVTVQPGGTVSAELFVKSADAAGPTCRSVPVDGLKVYPPHNRIPVVLKRSATGCAEARLPILSIAPVVSGD